MIFMLQMIMGDQASKDLLPNPILRSDTLIKMTFKVQKNYQNFVSRSYKDLDSLIVLQLFDPVYHLELISLTWSCLTSISRFGTGLIRDIVYSLFNLMLY